MGISILVALSFLHFLKPMSHSGATFRQYTPDDVAKLDYP